MKKVLIITYYWPPSGGAGVQRVLKTVKYLRKSGWEPIVFTAANAHYPILDASLEKDIPEGIQVIWQPIWEPYEWYKKFTGQKKEENVYSGFLSENKKPKLTQKLAVWIRGNYFIPDARCFWIKPASKFLLNWLKENKVDAMLSSGPPHSTHLIAKRVHDKIKIPWLADFRDPWTQIDFYDQLMLSKRADAKHKRLELSVLKNADAVSTVSWHWADDLKKIGGRKVEVITNGFDEADFPKIQSAPSKTFSLVHIGSLNGDRNNPVFWEAIKECAADNPGFKKDVRIRLVGKNDASVYQSIRENSLQKNLERVDYLPHAEVGKELAAASVLLLPLNNTPNILGIIPGKIFEYLAARKPVFVMGNPLGDSARIVRETGAGVICDFTDKAKMKTELIHLYKQWRGGALQVAPAEIKKYSREALTNQFAQLLDSITQK